MPLIYLDCEVGRTSARYLPLNQLQSLVDLIKKKVESKT
jgi:hypothetical protein